MRFFALITALILMTFAPAKAETPQRYGSIVVDADTLEIVHARQIDEPRFPASLTKVMTLYLVFDALNAGTLTLDEDLTVSKHAAKTSPVKLGIKAGKTITVDEAIQAVAVRSANDMAVVLAERIGGTEENFAAMMTQKALDLKMMRTTFKNPHGLPHPEQTTTARDMAKLASAVLNNHRRYYHYFGQTHFTYKGRTKKNTNALLHWLDGIDGFKTGYTRASGFNLVISATRENRRIIAVVLGGSSGKARNTHMQDLVERGFEVLGVSPVESLPPVSVTPKEPKEPVLVASTEAIRLRSSDNKTRTIVQGKQDIKIPDASLNNKWAIQVGTFSSMEAATGQLGALFGMADKGLSQDAAKIFPGKRGGQTLYQARFTQLSFEQADTACKTLTNLASGCVVIAPSQG